MDAAGTTEVYQMVQMGMVAQVVIIRKTTLNVPENPLEITRGGVYLKSYNFN